MGSFQQRKQEKWKQVIDAWRASGLGVSEFCRLQGVEENRLYYWRSRLAPSFKAANVRPAGHSKQPILKFLPMQVKELPAVSLPCNDVQAAPRIEVFFGNGALVRISGQLSDDKVAGIMKLAAGAPC